MLHLLFPDWWDALAFLQVDGKRSPSPDLTWTNETFPASQYEMLPFRWLEGSFKLKAFPAPSLPTYGSASEFSLDQMSGPPWGLRALRPRFYKQASQLTYGEMAQELVLEHWEQKGEQQGRDDLRLSVWRKHRNAWKAYHFAVSDLLAHVQGTSKAIRHLHATSTPGSSYEICLTWRWHAKMTTLGYSGMKPCTNLPFAFGTRQG